MAYARGEVYAMGEKKNGERCCWEEAEGWNHGMNRLSSAFFIASVVSCGLPREDLELLADYCSLLSHCFRTIGASERYCRR